MSQSQGSKCKHWCFTINNHDATDKDSLSALYPGACTYIIFEEEVGDSGTPHIQGYIEFSAKQRITSIKKIQVFSRAHLEPRKGKPKAAADYCRKDGQATELGTISEGRSIRGEQLVLARAAALGGASEAELAELPDYIRYRRHILESVAVEQQAVRMQRISESLKQATLRPWQTDLLKFVEEDPHPRKVFWVYDTLGGIGKTWFARYVVCLHGGIRFENGKSTDVKHAYNGEKTVIFDYSRSQQEHINYEIIESLKNGMFFSPKYNSGMRIFDIPHVFIFANFAPDMNKLSEDRWVIINLTDKLSPYD